MKVRRRRTLIAALLVASIPGLLAIADGALTGPRSIQDSWIGRMNPVQRLEAAGRIADYPVVFRAALIRSLSPEGQAQVWKQVAERYRDAQEHLNDQQRRVLADVIAMAVPATFSQPVSSKVSAAVKSLEQQVRQIFGEQASNELFRAGGPAERGIGSLPLRVRLQHYTRSLSTLFDGGLVAVVSAVAFTDCNCYTDGNVGPYDGECTGYTYYCSIFQFCESTWTGCQTWYLWPCNGYCIHPDPLPDV